MAMSSEENTHMELMYTSIYLNKLKIIVNPQTLYKIQLSSDVEASKKFNEFLIN